MNVYLAMRREVTAPCLPAKVVFSFRRGLLLRLGGSPLRKERLSNRRIPARRFRQAWAARQEQALPTLSITNRRGESRGAGDHSMDASSANSISSAVQ